MPFQYLYSYLKRKLFMSKDSFLYQWHNIILENNQRNYHNNEWSSNLQCPSSGTTSASVDRAIRSSSFSPRNRFKAVRLDCWMILFPIVLLQNLQSACVRRAWLDLFSSVKCSWCLSCLCQSPLPDIRIFTWIYTLTVTVNS